MGMQQVQELVPKVDQIKALYQLEEFKVLKEFLLENQNQLQAQLYGIKWKDKDALVEAAALTAQINLLGIIINLPLVVKEISAQFDKQEEMKNKAREIAEDPLEKGIS